MTAGAFVALAALVRGAAAAVLAPVRALRWRYLPLLMVYFASGAIAFSAIAEQFWIKERLQLSPEALAGLGVWLTVPWTIKMVFGQLVDGVPLFGSRRTAYVFVGAGLMASGSLLLAATAAGWVDFAPAESLYITAAMLSVLGLVVQDVVADAMSTEVVERVGPDGRPRPAAEVNAELGMVQVLGRLFGMFGLFAVAGLGGWAADILSYTQVFLLALIVPLISVVGAVLVRLEPSERRPVDRRVVLGGIAFGVFTLGLGALDLPGGQEIVFAVSMTVVVSMLRLITAEAAPETRRAIAYTALVIFVFRAMPSAGAGAQWWQIDVLGFDPAFFGTLNQIGTGIAILGIWLFSRPITTRPVTTVMAWLTVAGAVLSLPTIGMYYGLHEWTARVFGFGARGIALIDTSLASPFVQLSTIPMLTLIAIHAPRGRQATWFALMASFMNLALQAGSLLTKYLNQIYVVERGNYAELGALMIASTAIGLVVPLAAIALVGRRIAAAPAAAAPVAAVDAPGRAD